MQHCHTWASHDNQEVLPAHVVKATGLTGSMGSMASDLGRGGRAPRAMRSRAGCCTTTLCCVAAGTIADTGAAAAGAVAPDTLPPIVTVSSVSTQALGIQEHKISCSMSFLW